MSEIIAYSKLNTKSISEQQVINLIKRLYKNDAELYAGSLLFGMILEQNKQFEIAELFANNMRKGYQVFEHYKEYIDRRYLKKAYVLLALCHNRRDNLWIVFKMHERFDNYFKRFPLYVFIGIYSLVQEYSFSRNILENLDSIKFFTAANFKQMFLEQRLSQVDVAGMKSIAQIVNSTNKELFDAAESIFEFIYGHSLSDEFPLLNNPVETKVLNALLGVNETLQELSNIPTDNTQNNLEAKFKFSLRASILKVADFINNTSAFDLLGELKTILLEDFELRDIDSQNNSIINTIARRNVYCTKLILASYYMALLEQFQQIETPIQNIYKDIHYLVKRISPNTVPYYTYPQNVKIQQIINKIPVNELVEILELLKTDKLTLPNVSIEESQQEIQNYDSKIEQLLSLRFVAAEENKYYQMIQEHFDSIFQVYQRQEILHQLNVIVKLLLTC